MSLAESFREVFRLYFLLIKALLCDRFKRIDYTSLGKDSRIGELVNINFVAIDLCAYGTCDS